MPRVWNISEPGAPQLVLYCGRGSAMGNPFRIGRDGTRDEVCDKYEAMVESDPKLKAQLIKACRGWDLVCHCAPLRCHCDYLLRISNEDPDYVCVNGHDACGEMYAGPECPYCEIRSPE